MDLVDALFDLIFELLDNSVNLKTGNKIFKQHILLTFFFSSSAGLERRLREESILIQLQMSFRPEEEFPVAYIVFFISTAREWSGGQYHKVA